MIQYKGSIDINKNLQQKMSNFTTFINIELQHPVNDAAATKLIVLRLDLPDINN